MAISVSFLNIPNTDIDAESPVTSALMTAYRDRDQFLYEWLGRDYTPLENHNHDGINSARIKGQIKRSYFGTAGSGSLVTNGNKDVLTIPNVVILSGELCHIWITYVGDVGHGGNTGTGTSQISYNFTVLHNGVGIITLPNDFSTNTQDTKAYRMNLAHNVRYNIVRTGSMILRCNIPSPFFGGLYTEATMNIIVFTNP